MLRSCSACQCGAAQKRFASAAAALAPRPSASTSTGTTALPARTGFGTNRARRIRDEAKNPIASPAGFNYTSKQREEAYKERLAKNGISKDKLFAQNRERQRQLGISIAAKKKAPPPASTTSAASAEPEQAIVQRPRKPKRKQKALKKVDLPSGVVRLENLSSLLQTKLVRIQRAATQLGIGDVSPDRLLTSEDASLVALELGFDPNINDQTAFDLYPLPPLASNDPHAEPRPPITGIFGHVDHGKTSLLDALRKTSVAAGEAGGITQHIGAFQVRLADLTGAPTSSTSTDNHQTITFLDTPGHAAFTAMRSRGASVTDVVVLVVAADDGVKPQTEEVIGLINSTPDIGVVVAISKCDKQGIDVNRVKRQIAGAGLELEEFGGDVPVVEISSKTGQGLPELLETISVLAEMRELKAERVGRAEGRVIESRVEKGRGNVATVLVLRGCLRPQASLVAGTTWARVRSLVPPAGKTLAQAFPGQPVEVTGWKELPSAGDVVLEAASEDEAKLVVSNRVERIAQAKQWQDIEIINEKRRLDDEADLRRREEEQRARERGLRGNAVLAAGRAAAEAVHVDPAAGTVKELNLIIKADVSGTVEAVTGSVAGIGNDEARVKLVSSAVGDVQESDIVMARASEATIVAFNVKVPNPIVKLAARAPPVPIITSPIIYRLVEQVKTAVASLLPPTIETRVHGEATVQQIFEISNKALPTGKLFIAGSRVSNGTFAKGRKARVVRNGETVFVGSVGTLKQVKKDVDEVQKGVECGIALEGFQDWQQNDMIQSIEEIKVPRAL